MEMTEVTKLNSRIEKIQTQRTKIETRKEMLMATLTKDLESYAETYGVDLRKPKLSEMVTVVTKEKARVEDAIREEYELKLKVASAIENGDIATANKLLGIEVSEDVGTSEDAEDFDETVQGLPWDEDTSDDDDLDNFPSASGEGVDDTESTDENSDFEESEGVIDGVSAGDTDWGDLSVGDELEETPVETTGKSFLEAVQKAEPQKKSGGIVDFADDDIDDFGFGNITKGTKFGND